MSHCVVSVPRLSPRSVRVFHLRSFVTNDVAARLVLQEMHKLKRDHPIIRSHLRRGAREQLEAIKAVLGDSCTLEMPADLSDRPEASPEVKAAAARGWARVRCTSGVRVRWRWDGSAVSGLLLMPLIVTCVCEG